MGNQVESGYPALRMKVPAGPDPGNSMLVQRALDNLFSLPLLSSFSCYHEVLRINPNHVAARAGLSQAEPRQPA